MTCNMSRMGGCQLEGLVDSGQRACVVSRGGLEAWRAQTLRDWGWRAERLWGLRDSGVEGLSKSANQQISKSGHLRARFWASDDIIPAFGCVQIC